MLDDGVHFAARHPRLFYNALLPWSHENAVARIIAAHDQCGNTGRNIPVFSEHHGAYATPAEGRNHKIKSRIQALRGSTPDTVQSIDELRRVRFCFLYGSAG
jgi:hypothetical protein